MGWGGRGGPRPWRPPLQQQMLCMPLDAAAALQPLPQTDARLVASNSYRNSRPSCRSNARPPPPDSPTSYTFGLFDRLMVMLAGRVVYFGTTHRPMIDYFVGLCGAREPTVGDNLVEWLMVRARLPRMRLPRTRLPWTRLPGLGRAVARASALVLLLSGFRAGKRPTNTRQRLTEHSSMHHLTSLPKQPAAPLPAGLRHHAGAERRRRRARRHLRQQRPGKGGFGGAEFGSWGKQRTKTCTKPNKRIDRVAQSNCKHTGALGSN
jgi:hypothetical protein